MDGPAEQSEAASSWHELVVPQLNTTDKNLTNGRLCSECHGLCDDLHADEADIDKVQIVTCIGPCKRLMHRRCAEKLNLIKQDNI